MKKIVYKSDAIKAIIIAVAVLLIISVWPLKLIKYRETYEVPGSTGASSEVVNQQYYAQQIFIANDTHLDSLRLYVTEGTAGDEFEVTLLDAKQKQLAIEKITVPDTLPAYVYVLMDVETTVGEPYFFKVYVSEWAKDTDVRIGIEQWGGNPNVAAAAYYNDVPLAGMNYVADYTYIKPLDKYRALLFVGIVLFITLAALAITDVIFKKNGKKHGENDKLITVERAFKYTANPLVILLAVVCLIAVFTGFVSKYTLDKGFAVISIVLFTVILFYGINHSRSADAAVINAEYIREHIPDIIQSVAIAFSLQACCQYVSGLYDIHHRVAERKEMLWFCIIIIAMFGANEIFTLYNLIYTVLAAVAGLIYYRNTLTPQMTDDEVFALRITVVIAILFGLILIRTIKALCQKRLAKPNPIYGGLLAAYFISIVILRNTRWWTVVLAVSFTLLYLSYGMWNKKERFLTNLMRSIVLQFIGCTCWVLIHRPYSTYRSARYTHYFHTATITATYMTAICAAVLVLLLSKLYAIGRDDESAGIKVTLAGAWKELLLFGTVSSYLIFTMARTAYAAIFVTALFAIIMCTYGKGAIRLKGYLKTACYLLAAIIISLPVVFEVQRTIPALASDPVTYDIENYTDDTLRGRKLNSQEYMRVGRFVDVFADKILGLPEGTFDIYGEIEAYRLEYGGGAYTDEGSADEIFEQPDIGTNEDGYAKEIAENSEFENSDTLVASVGNDFGKRQAAGIAYGMLYEDYDGDGIDDADNEFDYTNGRISIYKSYLSQLNLTGHNTMGAVLENGEIASHAHDVYLQVAFDHGIIGGIIFIIFGIATFITGVIYYIKTKDKEKYAALPMVSTLAFAVAGLVEWVYHLSHPMAFILLMSITPLVFYNTGVKPNE